MSYSETLVVLARLQTDARFRQRFLSDRVGALRSCALTDEEQRRLSRLADSDVERMGAMAESHRILKIRDHLPWLDPVLRPDLLPLLGSYQQAAAPQRLNRLEATAFCSYVERLPRPSPPYLGELARYERLRIELSWGQQPALGPAHIETFTYAVEEVRAALLYPGWPAATATPSRLLFRKVPGLPAVLVRPVEPAF